MMRLAIFALIVLAGFAGPASASRPVKKTVTACVIGGELHSGRYVYRVRPDIGAADTDLRRFEGKRVRVKGFLLPGDILISNSIKFVPGNCPMQP